MVAKTVIDVILGEAGGKTRAERYADALAIASVIQNRADLLGVTPEDVVSVSSEFNAYGKALPPGTESLREVAEQAWNDVQVHGSVNNATFYATEKAAKNLPAGLEEVDSQGDHKFFSDPQARSIRTAQGFVTPASDTQPTMIAPNLEAITNPYAGLAPPTQVPTVSLPQSAPPPVSRPSAERTITPGAGLANLAPQAPARPDGINYGAVSYAHPSRGPWSAGLTPAVIDSVNMMAANNPRGASITSAYRSPSHPVEARKASPGQHARGTAYDLNLSGMTDAERAKAVETARMTGATRLGAYSKSPNMMHVDFADTHAPTRGGVYAMMDRSRHNMDRAPGWFTQGLDQVTVPTPTSRPETMGAPAGVVDRSPLPSLPKSATGTTIGPSADAKAGAGAQGAGTLSIPNIDPVTVQANPTPAAVPNAAGTLTVPSMADNTPVAPGFPSAPGFPAPPPAPGRQARRSAGRGALVGGLTGGLPGAILGGLLGPAREQITGNIRSNRQGMGRVPIFSGVRDAYRGMFGNSRLGGLQSPPQYASPYSVGSGYGAIDSTFGGPSGATAYSRSNPSISFTSLGNGLVSRTNKDTGVTYTMAPGDYNAGNNRSGKSGKK